MITKTLISVKTVADGKVHSIESICQNPTMSQGCNSADGRFEFDMLDIPSITLRFGDPIKVFFGSEEVFMGRLFEINRTDDIFIRHYIFYDESFYLRNVINYPVPKVAKMSEIIQGMLSRFEINCERFDDNGEEVQEIKIKVTSLLDAVMEILEYVSYMYQKMYVFRMNYGKLEFVDIEKAATRGFRDAYPLVINFKNTEEISSQTYNQYVFYKSDQVMKPSTATPPKSGAADTSSSKGAVKKLTDKFSDVVKNSLSQKSKETKFGKRGGKVTKYEFLTPLVPYEEQRINYEIAYAAIGGLNAAYEAAKTKPELIKDVDEKKAGYTIGSKVYNLTGEIATWGFLPFVRQVNEMPPEEVVNQMVNIHRNPVRKASYTILVYDYLYVPGDKLFIGENEDVASVYIIESVRTSFYNECVIQELEIFSWQKIYDEQKLLVEQTLEKIKSEGANTTTLKSISMSDKSDLITKKSDEQFEMVTNKLDITEEEKFGGSDFSSTMKRKSELINR